MPPRDRYPSSAYIHHHHTTVPARPSQAAGTMRFDETSLSKGLVYWTVRKLIEVGH
jgi:hypothetical protein